MTESARTIDDVPNWTGHSHMLSEDSLLTSKCPITIKKGNVNKLKQAVLNYSYKLDTGLATQVWFLVSSLDNDQLVDWSL